MIVEPLRACKLKPRDIIWDKPHLRQIKKISANTTTPKSYDIKYQDGFKENLIYWETKNKVISFKDLKGNKWLI